TGDASASPSAALSGSHLECPRLCRGMVTEINGSKVKSDRLLGNGGIAPAAATFLSISLRIISPVSNRVQHGEKLVGCAKAAGLQYRRRHGGERVELFRGIGAQIDFGALQAGVAEPE